MQAFPLTDVQASATPTSRPTMIYVHHVPQHDAADRLSALVAAAQATALAADATAA